MKIIVWNSQDKCVADYHKLIRGCDVLCLLDCGQWTVPVYALQIQNGLFHWKDEHEERREEAVTDIEPGRAHHQ